MDSDTKETEDKDYTPLSTCLREYGTQEQVAALYQAMVGLQGSLPVIEKTATGRQGNQKYMYATLASMIEAFKPHLLEHGLAILQPFSAAESGHYSITTILAHKAGGRLVSVLRFLPADTIKELGGQTTYFARYSYQRILGVNAEEDAEAMDLPILESRRPSSQPRSQQARPEQQVARPRAPQRPAAQDQGEPVARFGRNKGQLLSTLGFEDLQWLRSALEESVASPEKAQWREGNQRELNHVLNEISKRAAKSIGAPAPAEIEQPYDDAPHPAETNATQETQATSKNSIPLPDAPIEDIKKALPGLLSEIGLSGDIAVDLYFQKIAKTSRSEADETAYRAVYSQACDDAAPF